VGRVRPLVLPAEPSRPHGISATTVFRQAKALSRNAVAEVPTIRAILVQTSITTTHRSAGMTSSDPASGQEETEGAGSK
jgi:hypothetical protein